MVTRDAQHDSMTNLSADRLFREKPGTELCPLGFLRAGLSLRSAGQALRSGFVKSRGMLHDRLTRGRKGGGGREREDGGRDKNNFLQHIIIFTHKPNSKYFENSLSLVVTKV